MAPLEVAPLWSGQALVIVPTYNECENIVRLVCELRTLPGDVHVLVVDDNSTDGTGALVDAAAARDPAIFVLHRPAKLGLGTAYKAGFGFGLARDYQYLCTMDADFSHSPSSLPDLLNLAAAGADLAIGSRYVPGGKVVGWPRLRKMISHSANWSAHVFLGRRHARLHGGLPLLPAARAGDHRPGRHLQHGLQLSD